MFTIKGHGDFLRLIFVRAIEKLCCQTNFGISPVILFIYFILIANEPAERRRSAGEAAENSAARRMAYAKKFSIEL